MFVDANVARIRGRKTHLWLFFDVCGDDEPEYTDLGGWPELPLTVQGEARTANVDTGLRFEREHQHDRCLLTGRYAFAGAKRTNACAGQGRVRRRLHALCAAIHPFDVQAGVHARVFKVATAKLRR